MDKTSEGRLQLVHPLLADKVRQMAATLLQEGIEIRVVQGLRTYQEQAALYAKAAPLPVRSSLTPSLGLATTTPAWLWIASRESRGSNPWQPNWTDRVHDQLTPDYARMVEVGKSLGLFSGSDFA